MNLSELEAIIDDFGPALLPHDYITEFDVEFLNGVTLNLTSDDFVRFFMDRDSTQNLYEEFEIAEIRVKLDTQRICDDINAITDQIMSNIIMD